MLSPLRARFANELDDFVAYMASEQGLSPISIRSHRWKTSKFLEWFAIGIGSCRRPLWMMLMSSCIQSEQRLESRIGFHCGSGSALILPSRGAPRLGQGRNSRRNPRSQDLSVCRPPEGPTCDDFQRVLQSSKAQALLPSARGQSCFWSPFMDAKW